MLLNSVGGKNKEQTISQSAEIMHDPNVGCGASCLGPAGVSTWCPLGDPWLRHRAGPPCSAGPGGLSSIKMVVFLKQL